jgi:hypothetical protein
MVRSNPQTFDRDLVRLCVGLAHHKKLNIADRGDVNRLLNHSYAAH